MEHMDEELSFTVTLVRERLFDLIPCTVKADCQDSSAFMIQMKVSVNGVRRYHACKMHIFNVLMEANRASKKL